MKTVLSFGEVLWDIMPKETKLGGAPFNFTYRINSMGDKGRFVSRLGKDELGQKAFNRVKSLGMDTDLLQWDEHFPTGTVKVNFDEMNNPDYVIIPDVAYDQIQMEDALPKVAIEADCLYFGTLSQRSEQSRKTLNELIEKAPKAIKLLDINLRKECYDIETVSDSLKKADVLKCNLDELREINKILNIGAELPLEMIETLFDRFKLAYCLVTLDHRGAFAMAKDGKKEYALGYRIKLRDSLGAGDACISGFMHYLLQGKPLKEACDFGNMLGAIACTQNGATEPIGTKEVESFKEKQCERNHDFYFDQFLQ